MSDPDARCPVPEANRSPAYRTGSRLSRHKYGGRLDRKESESQYSGETAMTGRTIAHYQVIAKLGEGGMGVVYKARDTHLDRFVAIKVLPPEKVADPQRKSRFVQEAKAASALNHPNIIHIYDISQDGADDFIAMEYVPGKTLDQLIGRKGLALKDTLKYAIQ